MCPSVKLLKQSKNGVLTFCNESKLFQLVYNNLCFEFYEWELEAFKAHIAELDLEYWEKTLSSTLSPRKIPISVGNKYLVILVSRQEVYELKQLLTLEINTLQFLSAKDIDYKYIEN